MGTRFRVSAVRGRLRFADPGPTPPPEPADLDELARRAELELDLWDPPAPRGHRRLSRPLKDYEREIMAALRGNGWLPARQIAGRLGVPYSPTLQGRLTMMRLRGLIEGSGCNPGVGYKLA
jgi:hypothetical protein